MAEAAYTGPVRQMLEIGEPAYSRGFAWPEYRVYGLGPEHIPDLIRLATDQALICMPDNCDEPSSWGPVHAWRALGQLHAEAAVLPLLNLFHEVADNDWVIEEMPDVFAAIGPAAYPALTEYLLDKAHPDHSRMVAASCLMQLGLAYPEMRSVAVSVLAGQLEGYAKNSPGVNGVLIANLLELEAVDQTKLIQTVFTVGKVDRFIAGDWRDAKKRLKRAADTAGNMPASQDGALKRTATGTPPDPSPNPRPASQEPNTQPRQRA